MPKYENYCKMSSLTWAQLDCCWAHTTLSTPFQLINKHPKPAWEPNKEYLSIPLLALIDSKWSFAPKARCCQEDASKRLSSCLWKLMEGHKYYDNPSNGTSHCLKLQTRSSRLDHDHSLLVLKNLSSYLDLSEIKAKVK